MGIGAISALPKQLVNTAADGAFALTKYFS